MTAEATAALNELVGMLHAAFAAGALVFLRISAALALMPAFGEQVVPMRVRLALALAFAAIVAPAVGPLLPAGRPPQGWLLAGAAEVLVGLALGIVLRLFVIVLQVTGTMAAQATSLAQFFGGAGVDPQPAISQLMVMAGLALAVMAGLHVQLAGFFVQSYDLLPPGRFPLPGVMAEWGVGQVARAFGFAFTLAAPFVVAALIYNLALGAINRAMPQLMVAFVGAPALTLGGLVLLFLALPGALLIWNTVFTGFFTDPFGPAR